MKVSAKKKNERLAFCRENKKCPRCKKSIATGGHYVPALDLWTCALWNDSDILKCSDCNKQTTGIEATYRKFNTDLCHCGGMLKRVK